MENTTSPQLLVDNILSDKKFDEEQVCIASCATQDPQKASITIEFAMWTGQNFVQLHINMPKLDQSEGLPVLEINAKENSAQVVKSAFLRAHLEEFLGMVYTQYIGALNIAAMEDAMEDLVNADQCGADLRVRKDLRSLLPKHNLLEELFKDEWFEERKDHHKRKPEFNRFGKTFQNDCIRAKQAWKAGQVDSGKEAVKQMQEKRAKKETRMLKKRCLEAVTRNQRIPEGDYTAMWDDVMTTRRKDGVKREAPTDHEEESEDVELSSSAAWAAATATKRRRLQQPLQDQAADDAMETSQDVDYVMESSHAADDVMESSHAADDVMESSHAADDVMETSQTADDITETSEATDDVMETSQAADDVMETSQAEWEVSHTRQNAQRQDSHESTSEQSTLPETPRERSWEYEGLDVDGLSESQFEELFGMILAS